MNNKLNTQCNQNAQQWYFLNAMKKINQSKNKAEKNYYKKIVNYYLNGKLLI